MKRIISLFCTVVLVLSIVVLPVNASDSTTTAKIENAANLLEYLDITDSTYTSEDYSETISRADFAIYASRIINVPGFEDTDKRYFLDVPEDFWALNEINKLVENGAVTVPEDKKFRPDDPIKKAEAIKIILSIMKYDTYCQMSGGYPGGYLTTAYENDMADNLSSGEYMTYSDTIMLIYNSLEVPMMASEYNGNVLFKDECLLSYYFNMYSLKGQVTSAGGIAASGDKAYDGEVGIDEKKYYLENSNATEFLGQSVKAYIREASNDDMETVVAIESNSKKNTVLEINIRDVKNVNMSDYTIEYYIGNKTDTVRMNNGIMVLKNGENVSDNIKKAFEFEKGIIKLIDSDNDGYFDYAINNVYRNIIVGYIDPDTETIYDKLDNENKICLQDYTQKSVNIFKSGKKTGIDSIKDDMILTVFDSSEYVRIDICTETVSGTVFQMNTLDETEILVGVTETEADWYIVNSEYVQYAGANLKVGASGEFYLDSYKGIAYGILENDSEYKLAYVKRVIPDDAAYDGLVLDLFLQDGGHYALECSSRIGVDGTAAKDITTQRTLLQNTVGEVIRVKIRDNLITAVDTAKPVSESADSDSFCKTADSASQRYVYSQKRFGLTMMHSDDTVFFVVPTDTTERNKKLYDVVDRTFFVSSKSYNVQSYKLNSEEAYENVIVAKVDSSVPISAQTMLLISRKYTSIDADNEIVNKIEGFYGGSAVEFELAESCDFDGLAEGDIIQIASKDINGRILTYSMMYDYDDPSTHWQGDSASNHYSSYNYMCANVIDISNNILKLGYNDIANVDIMFNLTTMGPIIFYDENVRGANKTYKGSYTNLVPSNYCSPDCSKVVAWVSSGAIKWMVAYR